MQERTLQNLLLEGDDYIFDGNLTITGDVSIQNGNLIVSGSLVFSNKNANISIIGGNIAAKELESVATIFIRDGDIRAFSLDARQIDSDGNIEINTDSEATRITCLNYLVGGDNDSSTITAIQDVYILGRNYSHAIKARDVFIGGDCDLCDSTLIAKSFVCEGYIHDCSSMSVG